MKMKTDFVTNSSSTSFCMYGINIEPGSSKLLDQIKQMLKNGNNNQNEEREEENKEMESFELSEILRDNIDTLDDCKLELYDYDGYIYIGKSVSALKDHQTLFEFKEEIVNHFQKIGLTIKIEDIGFMSDCWFDG